MTLGFPFVFETGSPKGRAGTHYVAKNNFETSIHLPLTPEGQKDSTRSIGPPPTHSSNSICGLGTPFSASLSDGELTRERATPAGTSHQTLTQHQLCFIVIRTYQAPYVLIEILVTIPDVTEVTRKTTAIKGILSS